MLTMDEQSKKDFIQLFNQGFEEVVLPQIEALREEMATKEDVHHLEKRLIGVEERVGRVEDKLDKVTLDHTQQLTQHAQRLDRLESQSTTG